MESSQEQSNSTKAGKVAVAAVLAATLSAPVDPDAVVLPDPTPIVQTVDLGVQPDQPDSVVHADKKSTFKKILKMLGIALSILAVAGAVLFGVAKCTGSAILPIFDNDDTPHHEAQA